MAQNFSISEVIRSSWNILKKDIWLFAALVLVYLIIYCLAYLPVSDKIILLVQQPETYTPQLQVKLAIHMIIAGLIMAPVLFFFILGYFNISLQAVNENAVTLLRFLPSIKKIIFYFLASILFNIMLFIGFMLFIFPGIYLLGRFSFFVFYILDKESNPIEALKLSWDKTKGMGEKMFLFYCVLIILNLLGSIIGIGLVITLPLTTIAIAYIYKKYVNNEFKTLYT